MLEYFLCLDLLMLTRLVYLRNDEAMGSRCNLLLTALQASLAVLCFAFNTALWLVLLMLLIVGALNLLFETRLLKKGWRIFTLLFLVFSIDFIDGASTGLELRNFLTQAVTMFTDNSALLQGITAIPPAKLLGVLFGLLLLTNEINLFIRMVFHQFGLEPETQEPLVTDAGTHGIDKQEYNAGRVIGILERWLMYLVMISTNNLSAIAFIIAAKGLARMKQLEEKAFAEYMLIGTFLSVLSSVLIGKWVLMLLSV